MAASPVNYSRLKLLLVLEQAGAVVLKHTLDSGTHNTESLDLDRYLASLPPDSPVNYTLLSESDKKKQFNSSEKKQIRNNPKWDNFDVSLLYTSIQLACRDIAGISDAKWTDANELEGLLKKIKDIGNEVIHERPDISEKEFKNKVTELDNLFTNILNLVKVKYNVPPSHTTRVQDEVRSLVDNIRRCFDISNIWHAGSQPLMSQFRTMGKDHLKKVFENVQFIDPLHFLSGYEGNCFPISNIFLNLRVRGKQDRKLSSLDVLDLTEKQSSIPSPPPPRLVVVSGEAGSGKTTLLTYIMAKWVGCADNFSVKHLDTYDFVMRVLCRDSGADSLVKFVDPVFPEVFKAGSGIMYLLRKSRVLFLIDGLDEANAESKRLVHDILNNCKSAPGFTALCTSRPEGLDDFISLLPEGLGRCKVEIERVDPSDRTSFVLNHVASLAPDKTQDPGKVREVMEDIGWRDHFGLPLNLLFLSYLITEFPDRTDIYRTQTSLYVHMHEWCVEKLSYRLVKKVQIEEMQRRAAIGEVLKKMYFICLKSLLDDKLSLSEEDMKDLWSCCNEQALPSEEFLGAFFSQRKCIVNGVPRSQYLAPHKEILEFYGAQHIVRTLHAEYPRRSIRALLQECQKKVSINVEKQKNLLLHLAGLLSQPDKPLLIKNINEVVDLLAVSGGVMGCKEWLSLLAETQVNKEVLTRVAHHVGITDGESVTITDGESVIITDTTVFSAAALLPHIPRRKIILKLHRKRGLPNEMLEALATHTCTELRLYHHFESPGPTAASFPLLSRLPDRSHLEVFRGHLEPEDLALLPRGLEKLYLSVAGIPGLVKLPQALGHGENFPNLEWLNIHIPVSSVSPESLSSLTPLPCFPIVRLFLSCVGDGQVDAACRLAGAMRPRGEEGYAIIFFPAASLRADGWRRLVDGLRREEEAMWRRREEEEGRYEDEEGEKNEERGRKRREVKEMMRLVRHYVFVPSSTITEEEETQMNTLTHSLLGCVFERYTYEDGWGYQS